MRKILIALVVAAAAFTSLAGVAAADDPNPYITVERGTNYQSASCESHATVGVLGQYGAWGWFIDGCTSPRVYCPRLCLVATNNNINTYQHYGYRVTQNARLRVFNTAGGARWWNDRSCPGVDSCWNYDSYAYLSAGESASTQCNGVRENRIGLSVVGVNHCEVRVTFL